MGRLMQNHLAKNVLEEHLEKDSKTSKETFEYRVSKGRAMETFEALGV